MKNYLIQVSFYAPYPKKEEYRMVASNFGTAINRTLREWRKAHKGKKIKELNIKAIKL